MMDRSDHMKYGIAVGAVLGVALFLVGPAPSAPMPTSFHVAAPPTLQQVVGQASMHSAPARSLRSRGTEYAVDYAHPSSVTTYSVPQSEGSEAHALGNALMAPLLLVASGMLFIAAGLLRLCGKNHTPLCHVEPLSMAAVTSAKDDELSRRVALAGAVVASGMSSVPPAQAIPVKKVGDQIEALITRKIVSGELGISLADITRLVLHDAITFDPATKTGGFSGSIRFADELSRPENVGLEPVVRKLEALQKELQEATGLQISFADTEAFAGQMIAAQEFKAALCAKVGSCDVVYNAYGNKPKRLPLGREDSSGPDPEGRVPWVGSSVEDFKAAFKKVRLTARELCSLAPALLEDEAKGTEFLMQDKQCAGILKDLARSKETTTRTSYEVTFFDAYNRLVNLARINPKAYD